MFSNNILSIDLGSKYIKIARGQKLRSFTTINKLIVIPTPKNSIEDGKILNLDNIKTSIKNALDSEKIHGDKVVFTLKSTSVIIRDVILPHAKEEDLKSMVKYEISNYLPIDLDDYVIEYKTLECVEEDQLKKDKILVAALPRSIVDNYLKLAYELKLKPYKLDLSFNSMSACFDNDGNTIAVIDLGYKYIEITIISNGNTEFSRIINHGSRELDLSIANYFNLTLEEAERIRKEYSMKENESRNNAAMLKNAIEEILITWIEEINIMFKFYKSRNTNNKIDTVYIYGGGAKLEGICEYFSDYFEIPAFKIKDITGLRNAKGIKIDYDLFLNCIGGIMKS